MSLQVLNNFRSSVRTEYTRSLDTYLSNTIGEIDSEINDKITNLRVKDWKTSLTQVLAEFRRVVGDLSLEYDRFKIKAGIVKLNGLIRVEASRYRRLGKSLISYKEELEEMYCADLNSITEGYLEDIDVYRNLFKPSKNFKGVRLSNPELVRDYFLERTRGKGNVEDVIRKFIDDEVQRFRDLEVERILTSLQYKCVELNQTFDQIIREVETLRGEAIVELNLLVESLIGLLSEKALFQSKELEELIASLNQEYGIKVDVMVEEIGGILSDEVLTRIYTDCLSGTPNREFLLNVAATLNIYEDFTNVPTQKICDYIARAVGLQFG